jgi:hypothetical protein
LPSLEAARASEVLEVFLHALDPTEDRSTLGLESRFSRPPSSDATTEPGQDVTPTAQARQAIVELREFDLQLSFGGARVLGEDVEDQTGAIDDLEALLGEWVDPGQFFEVPALRRGQLIVEDHHVRVERRGNVDDLFGLAFAEICGPVRRVAMLEHPIDGFGPGGVGQRLELVERPLRILVRGRAEATSYENRALFGFLAAVFVPPGQVTTFLSRSTPSSSLSSGTVNEKRT